jgi:hypothetical protein
VQACQHADFITDLLSRSHNSASSPELLSAWEYNLSVHERAGNNEGVERARKAALKCKSAAVRGAGGAHKPKQMKGSSAKRRK